jgi:methylated-DNA-[protein]-cysteine S-methyltransferase
MKKQQQGTPFSAIVGAPFGAVGMRIDGAALVELVFLAPHVGLMPACDPVSRLAAGQLARYFADPDFRFDLPLAGAGSLFQRKVWAAIAAIPRGQVRTYGALARDIGSAARAVGQACGANPFPLLVPCHRITAASGLGGFAHHADGFHVGVKRWLLAHEAAALA